MSDVEQETGSNPTTGPSTKETGTTETEPGDTASRADASSVDAPSETAPNADEPHGVGGDGGRNGEAPGEPKSTEDADGASSEERLRSKLETAEAAAAASKERMLRVAADFENFRRRSVRELDETRARAKMDAVKEMLPVFDNLERAIGHADATDDPQAVVDGIRMVIKQFIDTLGKLGVERVDAVGHPFDPNLHESIQFEHSDDHAAGIVINEFHAGYRHGDKLLRPTLVVVSRGPQPVEAATGGAPAASTASEDRASQDGAAEDSATEDDIGNGATEDGATEDGATEDGTPADA
ncbi:MAG: nucleotide exchange factor GrpE [Myxococcota bacterium]